MKIVVTGASGYLGSNMCLKLLKSGYEVIGIDNFSSIESDRVSSIRELLTAEEYTRFHFIDADISSLDPNTFSFENIFCFIHFAGYKSLEESIYCPMKYYENNLKSTLNVCKLASRSHMYEGKRSNIIFSSSATLYSNINSTEPFKEDTPISGCSSPYGWSKLMSERIIKDVSKSMGLSCINLRYFNPVGADESGTLGEIMSENLMPHILRAANLGEELSVFGDDYDTRDGTCIRDYIYVGDLIDAHLDALIYLFYHMNEQIIEDINIGTGEGITVLEMIKAFSEYTGKEVPYKISGRRAGDPAAMVADNSKAQKLLGWHPSDSLASMCQTAQKYYENKNRRSI